MDPDKQIRNICMFVTDRTQERLAQSETRQLYEAINEAAIMAWADPDGKIEYVNQNFEEISGYAKQELLGKDHRILNSGVHPKQFFKDMWKSIRSGNLWRGEICNRKKNGEPYWVQTVIAPIKDLEGKILKFLTIRFDVSSQKIERVVETEKLSSLGLMAASLAHEINTPLAVVISKLSKIRRQLLNVENLDPEMNHDLGKLISHTERIARIVKGLKVFSRKADADPFTQTKLGELVEDTMILCQERFLQNQIEFKVCDLPDLSIECRPTQISQVLFNLFSNAFDSVVGEHDKWVELSIQDQGEYVHLLVRDSGKGIKPENISKIFIPFFTTKELGKGTGLGLSVARDIVLEHKGELYVDQTQPNTTFVLRLPKIQSSNDEVKRESQ